MIGKEALYVYLLLNVLAYHEPKVLNLCRQILILFSHYESNFALLEKCTLIG